MTQSQQNFITVPEVALPNGKVVPSFKVAQYLCSQSNTGDIAVNGASKPWVNISYHDAVSACKAQGFVLITELQALAIAHDIASQDINWTGGKVGEGSIYQGLHQWTANSAQAGDYISPNEAERRWHQLSNGERIHDFAGNAYTWVFDDVQGDECGLIAKPFAENSPSVTTAPYPRMEKGMGWYPRAGSDWSGGALIRGGCWGSKGDAGVFYLGGDWPGYAGGDVGFRCTK